MKVKKRKVNLESLLESLQRGQKHKILESSLGVTIDGHKRKIVSYGTDIKLESEVLQHNSPEEALEDMFRFASVPECRTSVRDKYVEIKKLFPDMSKEEIVEILMALTHKSRRTLYNWLSDEVKTVQNCTDMKSFKPIEFKGCKHTGICTFLKDKDVEINKLLDQISQLKNNMVENLSKDQFKLEQAINLFIEKTNKKPIILPTGSVGFE